MRLPQQIYTATSIVNTPLRQAAMFNAFTALHWNTGLLEKPLLLELMTDKDMEKKKSILLGNHKYCRSRGM